MIRLFPHFPSWMVAGMQNKLHMRALSTSLGSSGTGRASRRTLHRAAFSSSSATTPLTPPPAAATMDALKGSIESAGAAVRQLKATQSSKESVAAAVAKLLDLKAQLAAFDANSAHEPLPGAAAAPLSMEQLTTFCKSKGFIYPSSEIYSPYPGFFDYGPLGVELKNNIKKEWWKEFVQKQEDVVGLDSSIICSPSVWEASGHVAGFSDPMVDCKVSKLRYRADQVYWGKLVPVDMPMDASDITDRAAGQAQHPAVYVSILECASMQSLAHAAAIAKAKKLGLHGPFHPFPALRDLTNCASAAEYALIPSPATGNAGDLTPPRDFNLMFQTWVGATATSDDVAAATYLRPETAQGIFTNFANVQRTSRMKIPFGIAQIGKAFRNEITPRNFIFRSREFEQMELEYFISDNEAEWEGHYSKWLECSWNWLLSIGINENLLQRDVKTFESGIAHYARACTDITFQFPFGQQELMGVAARGNYDLMQHAASSGEKLDYFEEGEKDAAGGGKGRRYVPHVIEPSIGVDRLLLALLTSAYREEAVSTASSGSSKERGNEKRVVLGLHPRLAPISVAIFPLVSNKPELVDMAKRLYKALQQRYRCEYDTSGAIGRRYRRADEIGTPFCITVDHDSLVTESVTVRYRDSMEQVRLPIKDLLPFLTREIEEIEL